MVIIIISKKVITALFPPNEIDRSVFRFIHLLHCIICKMIRRQDEKKMSGT